MNVRSRILLIALSLLLGACSSTYVVDSDGASGDSDTSDNVCETSDGDCTLTAAIQQANASNGADIITFDGVTTINVDFPLPAITDSNLTIDGGGQVTLDGGQNLECSGFAGINIVGSSYNIIRGLTILNFGTGVRIDSQGGEARYNIIGYNPNSNSPLASQRNIISGNCRGIYVTGSGAADNSIAGNYIGTTADGLSANPNQYGIILQNDAHDNLIGGSLSSGGATVSDPAGHWSLDENSGAAIDQVNGNNLAETSGAIGASAGIVSGARDFSAPDTEYFMHADIPEFSAGNASFTWSLWVNPDALGTQQALIGKGAGATLWTYEYLLTIGANGTPVFRINNGSMEGNVTASVALTSGQWNHIVAFYDALNDEIGIYVNGFSEVNTATGGSQDTNGPLVVGAMNTSTPSLFFDGQMDELSFWKRVLTEQEVSTLYNGGSGLGYGESGNPGRNIISGNATVGMLLANASNNHISGNFIGVAANGVEGLGNQGNGIHMDNGADGNVIGINPGGAGSGNVIVDNHVGIEMQASDHNIIAGNRIGTNADGSAALGNGSNGIIISQGAVNNVVGTNGDGAFDEVEGNLVSGNGATIYRGGVWLASNNNVVAGNRIGTNADGSAAIPNASQGISLTGDNNRIGTDGDGTSDALEGNLISGNATTGIAIGGAFNQVSGNLIGTDASGLLPLGNHGTGIRLASGSHDNLIGTDGDGSADSAERNVISDNAIGMGGAAGIRIDDSDNNVIAGNYIGVDASGQVALGNHQYGMTIQNGASGNLIGTDGDGTADAAEGNVISANDWLGVWILSANNNTLAGNRIGSDAAGTSALPNGHATVELFGAVRLTNGASNNIIGTNGDGAGDAAEGNLISGNAHNGIEIRQQGTSNNVVTGNRIGVDISGATAMPNALTGITISGGADNNRVGTNADGVSDSAEANVIAGNLRIGVYILGASGNQVAGNYIGTDSSGQAQLGNGDHGVEILSSDANGSADNNWVGGAPNRGNVIAFNLKDGVRILGGGGVHPDNAMVLYNSIYSNEWLGINLINSDSSDSNSVTLNDEDDGDIGPNGLLNYPALDTALAVNNSISISGDIADGLPNTSMLLQFFASPECDPSGYGEGQTYLGDSIQVTNGNGDAGFLVSFNVAVPAGHFITATATSADDTSEFSACIVVDAGQQLQGELPPNFSVTPNRNINCRYACTTLSDIADTLLEGIVYVPLGYDPQTGYFMFEGPSFGETCYAAPIAGGTPLMALELDGLTIEPEEIASIGIDLFSCPAFSTPTPTLYPDESYDATPTPLPQCSDGLDNDGDGLTDYVAPGAAGAAGDRECDNAQDNDESR